MQIWQDFRFKFDNAVHELENANRWQTAVDTVYSQWEQCPGDLNHLLCAGTQLWYTMHVMLDLKYDPPTGVVEYTDDDDLQEKLARITAYGVTHFADNLAFNVYFGYMISVSPHYFFYYKNNLAQIRTLESQMFQRARNLAPDNPFVKAFCMEGDDYGQHLSFYRICEEIWKQITYEEWGNSAVQSYFFRILCGNSILNID